MKFEDLLAEFDSKYNIQLLYNTMSPVGPVISRMFKMPEYAHAATVISQEFPHGIYLMPWEQESLLPDNLGSVFFVRFRGIT